MYDQDPRPRLRISDATFDKSLSNRRTENHGVRIVTSDPRFQWIPSRLRRVVLDHLGVPHTFSNRTFDVVMTDEPVEPITDTTIGSILDEIRLVEIKVTQARIHDEHLSGFFFGATANEFEMAALLGDRYLFALVVLGIENTFHDDFFVLLTLDELEERIQSKRTQFQVTLVKGVEHPPSRFGFGPKPPPLDRPY